MHRQVEAIAEGELAIALDPDYAVGYIYLGHMLIYVGRPEEGIAISQKGIPLDPPLLYHYLLHIADGYWMMGRHEEALANLKRSVTLKPDWLPSYFWIAAINIPYKDPAMVERYVNGLRKAGLPETSIATAR